MDIRQGRQLAKATKSGKYTMNQTPSGNGPVGRNKGTNVGDVTAETAVSLSVSQSQLQEPLTSQLPLKKTSFQITSVTTIDSSASNDGGEESGEEEMETGGGSSEIPSDASHHTNGSSGIPTSTAPLEDSFTRNDVFFNPSPVSAMSTVPVIPTSSQYGLAMVSSSTDVCIGTCTSSSTVTTKASAFEEQPSSLPQHPVMEIIQNQSNTPGGSGEKEQEKDQVHNRFKVVKIERTQPFKKGRWMCMDYFDQATSSAPNDFQTLGISQIPIQGQTSQPPHTLPSVNQNQSMPNLYQGTVAVNQSSPNLYQQGTVSVNPILNQIQPQLPVSQQTQYYANQTAVSTQPGILESQAQQQQQVISQPIESTQQPVPVSVPIQQISQPYTQPSPIPAPLASTSATPVNAESQHPSQSLPQVSVSVMSVKGLVACASPSSSLQQQAQPTVTSSSFVMTNSTKPVPDDGDSASGANTVAIDNKIEQAMDLVKSHLMFAVREEVEVLKERIVDLMDRINHLECENTILRTNATPETLAQLAQNSATKASNPSSISNT